MPLPGLWVRDRAGLLVPESRDKPAYLAGYGQNGDLFTRRPRGAAVPHSFRPGHYLVSTTGTAVAGTSSGSNLEADFGFDQLLNVAVPPWDGVTGQRAIITVQFAGGLFGVSFKRATGGGTASGSLPFTLVIDGEAFRVDPYPPFLAGRSLPLSDYTSPFIVDGLRPGDKTAQLHFSNPRTDITANWRLYGLFLDADQGYLASQSVVQTYPQAVSTTAAITTSSILNGAAGSNRFRGIAMLTFANFDSIDHNFDFKDTTQSGSPVTRTIAVPQGKSVDWAPPRPVSGSNAITINMRENLAGSTPCQLTAHLVP